MQVLPKVGPLTEEKPIVDIEASGSVIVDEVAKKSAEALSIEEEIEEDFVNQEELN